MAAAAAAASAAAAARLATARSRAPLLPTLTPCSARARPGSLPGQLEKITSRIAKLCIGLNMKFIDPAGVAVKVVKGACAPSPPPPPPPGPPLPPHPCAAR